MLDDDVIAGFRARASADGTGYQTEIIRALRATLQGEPVTLNVLRSQQDAAKVLRHFLKRGSAIGSSRLRSSLIFGQRIRIMTITASAPME